MLGLSLCIFGFHDWHYWTEDSGKTKRSCRRCVTTEEIAPDYSMEFADYTPVGGPRLVGVRWERID